LVKLQQKLVGTLGPFGGKECARETKKTKEKNWLYRKTATKVWFPSQTRRVQGPDLST